MNEIINYYCLARNIGTWFDENMNMVPYTNKTCKASTNLILGAALGNI